VAKKSSAEKEIEKNPGSGKKKDVDSVKSSKDFKQSVEDLRQFLKDSLTELKKIQWPTRRQAIGETIVVLITVIFLTSLVVVFDKILPWLFSYIF